jgi:hypothetical protein
MSEQQPPPGYRKDFWGRLVEDPNYEPPSGYRLARNFFTNRLELHALTAPGVHGLDEGNSQPQPNYGPSSRKYSFATPDPTKVADGILFTGKNGQDPNVDRSLARPGKNRYNSTKDDPAIF